MTVRQIRRLIRATGIITGIFMCVGLLVWLLVSWLGITSGFTASCLSIIFVALVGTAYEYMD
jgi:succinate dehydrogenase/fumarate reductase cytochrome b subunit